ncbi:Fatty acid desaturase [Jatrophihabitans endophyticus]|uniref:Fatty acid desaturase n=1 Tax=Jatrophihabitans endophyticus TaxID=1206085 RepID=A0A1M5P8N7_9ACTN|nr:acyl-CoA desaturase [Jatrophihabitans endophyticus]SHG98150.1 Fatty acid desaturase [Jatrophihabitans endophyticus]
MSLALPVRRGSDFAALSRQIRDAHLLDRRRVSYTIRIAGTLLAYVAVWAAFVVVGRSWFQPIVAAVMGLVFTQVAFLGHDGGHQQVWRSRRANDLLGIVAGDLLTGLSYGWWVDKHNRHHAKPNHEGHDPDIGEGVLAFTTEQAANRTGAFARFVTRNQAYLFFPLLTLEGLNLHVSSVASLRRRPAGRYRRLEIVLFALHVLGYAGAVLWVVGPLYALVFVGVQQAVFGLYMGCSFAPNHKGMPVIAPGVKIDFLRRQVLTSRNVRGGRVTDFVLGGLNYQVEHHLFPNMPRPNLRHAQHLVRSFCAHHEIPYTETSLLASYGAALRALHELGAPLRTGIPGVSPA